MGVEKEKLKSYAVVEMMGHRKIVGLVTESDISGGQLLRVDVLNHEGNEERTEYIGVGSIYCLTIVSEEAAKAVAASNSPKPTWAWDLPRPKALPEREEYLEGDDDDDENPY